MRPSRRVVAVARNVTSTTRLLDVLPLIDVDQRIEVVFTINHGSAFEPGLHRFLGDLEANVMPWKQAVRADFDLAIAANVNVSLRRLAAPLVVLPHGAGYNRLVEASTGDLTSATGLSRRELVHRGRVVPAVIGLSHEEQLDRLRRDCHEALDRARVVGDPCFDRIAASTPRREYYRRALGVGGDRRLVVVTSTWNRHSLLAGCPDLPERLAAQLPVDEYQVAVVLHPNIWSWHSPYQVRGWLRQAMDAGALVIPPREGWRAALVAADLVVGDHGSVTFYGAALDRLTVLAASGEDELDPASPTARFVRAAPRLDPRGDLLAQVERAAAGHRPGRHDGVTGRSLGLPGRSGQVLRDTLYQLMDLPPPAHPPRVRPLPPPVPERGEDTTAFLVSATVDDHSEPPRDGSGQAAGPTTGNGPLSGSGSGSGTAGPVGGIGGLDGHGGSGGSGGSGGRPAAGRVELRRYPAALDRYRLAAVPADAFLAVDTDEVDRGLLESAEVIVRHDSWALEPATRWAARTLAEYPGASLAASVTEKPDRLVLRTRDDRTYAVRIVEHSAAAGWYRGEGRDPRWAFIVACGLFAWLTPQRRTAGGFTLLVRAGEDQTVVAATAYAQ